MPDVQWMDFSGAPPVLIPVSCRPEWNDLYVPAVGDDQMSDLQLPNGQWNRASAGSIATARYIAGGRT